jgi:hypothetical protein
MTIPVLAGACDQDYVGVAQDGAAEAAAGHGRHEERYAPVITHPEGLPGGWPDVAAVVQVNRGREVAGKNPSTTHFYLTSYTGTAAEIAGWVHGHWEIENGLH